MTDEGSVDGLAGLFVVLVGPDGTGKTTIASELIELHHGHSLYVHFRPSVSRPPDSRPLPGQKPPAKRRDPGFPPAGWLRITASLLVFWIGYLRWIRPALRDGALVVGDRWVYGYVAQPTALGFAGPVWLARVICNLAPTPDLVVRLSAPPDIVSGRKSDLTALEIESEDRSWNLVRQIGLTVDATDEPGAIAKTILRAADRNL